MFLRPFATERRTRSPFGRMAFPGKTGKAEVAGGVPPVFCERVRNLWKGGGITVIQKMKECASV